MRTLKVGMDTFALSSFFFQPFLTNHMIWCCWPLIFQMGIILPLILRYIFCWNYQENCLCEIWRIRPLKGKIPFISLFQANELSPAKLRKRWGQVQPGLAVSHGRGWRSHRGQWEVGVLQSNPGELASQHTAWVPACWVSEERVGMPQMCQAGRLLVYHPYLCAALQVLLCHSEGQLPIAPLQEQG